MAWFRKTSAAEPLPVTMAGVKMGDRLLAIGGADSALIAALASKTGLTGETRVVEADEERAGRTAAAIERHGALADVQAAAWSMLPYDSGHFDVAVAINMDACVPVEMLPRCAAEVFRVLRPGGRFMMMQPRGRRSRGSGDESTSMLQTAGFAAVRVVAERGGMQYVEGIKRGK
jgi:cyclopropane fatty-acyl-phospholipid synthase-like methyltransferase